MRWAIGLGILFPIFFQLDGGVYRDAYPLEDSLGVLSKLPLPVSILVCVAILAFLAGNLDRVKPAVAMIFGMLAVGFVSLWLGSDGLALHQRKLIMTLQVMLPLAGLLLGQLVGDKDKVIARAFLCVLSIVVPIQLLATWWQDGAVLTSYLYVFSIYSHIQYVPLIFVCAFAYSLISLWSEHKVWLCILAGPLLFYATTSYSFLTVFACISVLVAFLASSLRERRIKTVSMVIALAFLVIASLGLLLYFGKTYGQRTPMSAPYEKFELLLSGNIPANVQERFADWKLFGKGIIETKKTLVFGHPQPMPREIRSSPHNWYMDIAYTFGVIGLLPIFGLIAYTSYVLWKSRKVLPLQTWWLAGIVFYLVVIDSNFKVTLRQPYPGIFAYFMWGLLLFRLRPTPSSKLSSDACAGYAP